MEIQIVACLNRTLRILSAGNEMLAVINSTKNATDNYHFREEMLSKRLQRLTFSFKRR